MSTNNLFDKYNSKNLNSSKSIIKLKPNIPTPQSIHKIQSSTSTISSQSSLHTLKNLSKKDSLLSLKDMSFS